MQLWFYPQNEAITVLVSAFVLLFFLVVAAQKKLWNGLNFSKEFMLLFFALAAFEFITLAGIPSSINSYCSSVYFNKILLYTGFFLLLGFSSLNNKTLPGFFWHMSLFGGFYGAFSIAEYFEGRAIPDTWLDPSLKKYFKTRSAGLLSDPNINAFLLGALFLFSLYSALSEENKKKSLLASLSAVLSGTGLMCTLSRGGWISAAFALFVIIALLFLFAKKLSLKKFNLKLSASIIAILLLIFFIGPFKYRFVSIAEPKDMTLSQRTLINDAFKEHVRKIPLLGYGLDSFLKAYPLFRKVGGDYPMYMHNEFLQTWVESGVFAALAQALIVLTLILILSKSIRQKPDLLKIFLAGFLAMTILNNLGSFSARIFPTAMLIAVMSGMIAAYAFDFSDEEKTEIKISGKSTLLFSRLLAIALIFSSLSASFKLVVWKLDLNFLKIVDLLEAENKNAARKLCGDKIAAGTNDPLVYYKLAKLWQNDNAALEVEALEEAVRLSPGEPIYKRDMARIYLDIDTKKSDRLYKEALFLDPASEHLRAEYAEFLILEEKKSEALAQIEKGLSYSPGFHSVYKGFARLEELKKLLVESEDS